MKKLFVMSALLLSAICSKAANYYISTSIGNDSRTSTQAQSPSSPWQTITKLNSVMSGIHPGDSILFRKGDTFPIPESVNRGGLLVTVSGTAGAPIVIGAYGTGAAPILTYPPITPFTGSGPYLAVWVIQSCCSLLYEDGIPLPKASSTSCSDGNWYGTGGVIYYKPTSGTPTSHRVTVANIDNSYIPGIDLSDRRYVTVTGLQFNGLGVGIKAFDVGTGNVGLMVNNCTFNYCQTGVYLLPNTANNTSSTIQNSTFYRCQNAIRMYTAAAFGGTSGIHTGCKILNNRMTQLGTTNGTKQWQTSVAGTDFEAIGLQDFMNGTIQGNVISGGYTVGISWYNLNASQSSNNLIKGNFFISNGKAAIGLIGENTSGSYNYAYNNNTFCNNVFINSDNIALTNPTVQIYQGTKTTGQNYLINNTFVGNFNTWYFATANAPYFTIENNIVYNSGQNRWMEWNWSTKPASLTVDYNLYYEDSGNYSGTSMGIAFITNKSLAQMAALGMEAHSIAGANPLFLNPPDGNYTLQAGSPAINKGVNVGIAYTGTAPDIGAFEYK
jgi:hypothetical protein